eukprot:453817-Hanusia_phi.AAC.1
MNEEHGSVTVESNVKLHVIKTQNKSENHRAARKSRRSEVPRHVGPPGVRGAQAAERIRANSSCT